MVDPRNWVVVVANLGSTHYDDVELVERVKVLAKHPGFQGQIISTMYVGD